MTNMAVTLEVVGPNRGRSFQFRDYEFTEGRIRLSGTIEQVSGACIYLERTCQAYPVGSDELIQMRDKIHGVDPVHSSGGGGKAAEVSGGGEKVPEPPAPTPPVVVRGDNATEAGSPGVLPIGSGPEGPPANTRPVKPLGRR